MLAAINGDDIIGLVMTVLVGAYLLYALLRPEEM